jgi:hypothetical protein
MKYALLIYAMPDAADSRPPPVFSASGHLGSAPGVVAGVQPALAASAGLSLAGALTGLAVGRRRAVSDAEQRQARAGACAELFAELGVRRRSRGPRGVQ